MKIPATIALRKVVLGLCLFAGLIAVRSADFLPSTLNSQQTAGMLPVPSGVYVPLQRTLKDAPQTDVAAFLLDERPVTNAEFLAFVAANSKWQRSKVSPLFADSSYLENWAGDLTLGNRAPENSPVVRVSWFAARAYARWAGKRLPLTAEWELAASAGYSSPDGKNDEQLKRDLYAWLARPVPAIQADVITAKANFHGVRGLHGLVWEWVDDFNTAMVTGESRADSGLERDLFCGAGSVGAKDTTDYAAFMRQALRSSLKANNTTSSLGFRCARIFLGKSFPFSPLVFSMKALSLIALLSITFLVSSALFLVGFAKDDAAKSAGCACCQEKPTVKAEDKSCCKEPLANAPFSKTSLYQSDATFTDDSGKTFALGSLRGRPVALNMFFSSCGYACPLTVTDLLAIQAHLPSELRSKAVFVLVSFDVTRDTTEVLAKYRAQRGLDAQWILLRGDDDSVRELAALLGVKFKQEADGSFAHSNIVTILNTEGEIIHQRTGLQGGLNEAAAVLAAIVK